MGSRPPRRVRWGPRKQTVPPAPGSEAARVGADSTTVPAGASALCGGTAVSALDLNVPPSGPTPTGPAARRRPRAATPAPRRPHQQRHDHQQRPRAACRPRRRACAAPPERKLPLNGRSASARPGRTASGSLASTGAGSTRSARQTLAANARAKTAVGQGARCCRLPARLKLLCRHLEAAATTSMCRPCPRGLRAAGRRPSCGCCRHGSGEPSVSCRIRWRVQSSKFPRSYAVASRDWGKRRCN